MHSTSFPNPRRSSLEPGSRPAAAATGAPTVDPAGAANHPTSRAQRPGRPGVQADPGQAPAGGPAERPACAGNRRPAASPRSCPDAGDGPGPGGWEQAVRRHGGHLANVTVGTLRRCGVAIRAEEVEDLVQEVWCRMLERWGPRLAFDGGDERLRRYLSRTTRNVALDEVRRRRAVKRSHDRAHNKECLWQEYENVADRCETPEERLLRREARQRFRQHCAPFVGALHRERNLDVLEMAVLDGMTSPQVAARIGRGMTASTVDVVVHRTRRRLASEGFNLPLR